MSNFSSVLVFELASFYLLLQTYSLLPCLPLSPGSPALKAGIREYPLLSSCLTESVDADSTREGAEVRVTFPAPSLPCPQIQCLPLVQTQLPLSRPLLWGGSLPPWT